MSDKPKGNNKVIKQFYLNWKFWLILLASLVVLVTLAFLIFTPTEISKSALKIISDPAIYVTLSVVAAGVAGVWSKVKEVLDKAEKKADKAVSTTVELSDRVDTNAEKYAWLEKSMEAYGRMAHNLTDDLQQERAETKLVTAELKKQIEGLIIQVKNQQTEINRLKEIMLKQNEESIKDKEQISMLQSRVRELEIRLAKSEAENVFLRSELEKHPVPAGVGADLITALVSGEEVQLQKNGGSLPGSPITSGDKVQLNVIEKNKEGE
ncbi:MAG: hypothetical protein H0X33_13290 [Taibaiella sp.]|nr:hypothetical protein [Taibaiella sp.]